MNNYDYIVNSFTKDEDNVNLEINNLNVGCITSKNNKFSLDSEGNLTVKSITAEKETTISKNDIINIVYPVGSIYIAFNSTNPQSIFGGTWEIIQDRFLIGAGNSYALGNTGGEVNVTLGVNNIPSHNHTFSGTTDGNGNHSHTGNTLELRQTNSYNYSNDAARPISSSATHYGMQITNDAGWHQHTYSGTTSSTGSGQAHNNMPPYIAVYMWKRTA